MRIENKKCVSFLVVSSCENLRRQHYFNRLLRSYILWLQHHKYRAASLRRQTIWRTDSLIRTRSKEKNNFKKCPKGHNPQKKNMVWDASQNNPSSRNAIAKLMRNTHSKWKPVEMCDEKNERKCEEKRCGIEVEKLTAVLLQLWECNELAGSFTSC